MFGLLFNLIFSIAAGALGVFIVYLAICSVLYLIWIFYEALFATPIPEIIGVILLVWITFVWGVRLYNWIFTKL